MKSCDLSSWAALALPDLKRSFTAEHARTVTVTQAEGDRIRLFQLDPMVTILYPDVQRRCDLAILRETENRRTLTFVELKGKDFASAEKQLLATWQSAQKELPAGCRNETEYRFVIAGERQAAPRQRRDGKRRKHKEPVPELERLTGQPLQFRRTPRGASVDITDLLG